MMQPLSKAVWQILTKLNILVSYESCASSHVPWNLSKEGENLCLHKNLHMMYTAVLFIIAKTQKQPRCPLAGEWINTLWYTQTMEYNSELKRNAP